MQEGRKVKFAPFKPLPKLSCAINEGLAVKKELFPPETRDAFILKAGDPFVEWWQEQGKKASETLEKNMKEVQPMINLYDLMKLVDNTTKVRIEVKSEEMALTPHKLAVYGEHMVKKVFVNCQGELEVELSDEKPMHCR